MPSLSGIGRYVLEMAKVLSKRGHSLILYLPEKPRHALPELSNVRIRVWNYAGPIMRIWWSRSILPAAANADELDVFWGPAHRLPKGLSKKIPCVVTIHDLVWRRASETMRWQTWVGERLFMENSLKKSDIILAVSESTCEDIINDYKNYSHKIKVVYPGLTELNGGGGALKEDFSNWNIDRPFSLFVGTLEPRKNLPRLIEAYSSLPRYTRDNLLLVIAGKQGWHSSDLPLVLRKYGVEKNIRLTGYITDRQLFNLYNACEFLLMPSLYEGFGFPIIEAQSLGKPVITSNISSMPEIAQSGALLVNPYVVEDLTSSIQALATDVTLQQTLGAQAKENAKRFSWNKAGKEIEDIFLSLVEKERSNNC